MFLLIADARDKALADGILGGMLRRAFLKGVMRASLCGGVGRRGKGYSRDAARDPERVSIEVLDFERSGH